MTAATLHVRREFRAGERAERVDARGCEHGLVTVIGTHRRAGRTAGYRVRGSAGCRQVAPAELAPAAPEQPAVSVPAWAATLMPTLDQVAPHALRLAYLVDVAGGPAGAAARLRQTPETVVAWLTGAAGSRMLLHIAADQLQRELAARVGWTAEARRPGAGRDAGRDQVASGERQRSDVRSAVRSDVRAVA